MAMPNMSNNQSATSGVGATYLTGSYEFGGQTIGAPPWAGMQSSDKTMVYIAGLGVVLAVVMLWKSKK